MRETYYGILQHYLYFKDQIAVGGYRPYLLVNHHLQFIYGSSQVIHCGMYHIFIEESKLLGIFDACCLSQLILQSSLCSLCLSQLLGNALQYSGLYGCIRTCTLNSQYSIRQSPGILHNCGNVLLLRHITMVRASMLMVLE